MTTKTIKKLWIANFIFNAINIAIIGNSEWNFNSVLAVTNLMLCLFMLIHLFVPTIQPKGSRNNG